MNTMKTAVLASLVAMLMAAGTSQAEIIIDNFSDFMTPVVAPATLDSYDGTDYGWYIQPTTAGQTYVETGLSGVVGGARKSVLWSSRATAGSNSVVSLYLDPVYGNSYSVSNGSAWNTIALTYNADGAGLNLNASAGTKFSADMYFDHLGNLRNSILSITVVDGQAHTSTISRTWSTYTTPDPNPQTYSFLFSEFTGINFNEIDSITLSYSSDNANDYEIYAFTSDIPEPATMTLLALGGLALIRRRRK